MKRNAAMLCPHCGCAVGGVVQDYVLAPAWDVLNEGRPSINDCGACDRLFSVQSQPATGYKKYKVEKLSGSV